jgi:hypothetical protein
MEDINYVDAKFRDFQKYFNITGHKVEFNGKFYMIIDEEDVVITSARTNEEIYSYVVGYLNAYKVQEERIGGYERTIVSLSKMNEENIQRYEAIIKEMGGETIEEDDLTSGGFIPPCDCPEHILLAGEVDGGPGSPIAGVNC